MYVEAMRAGKPVIGTNAGGIPEVVDDGRNRTSCRHLAMHLHLPIAMLRLGADADLQQTLGATGLATLRAAIQPLQLRPPDQRTSTARSSTNGEVVRPLSQSGPRKVRYSWPQQCTA